MIITIQPIPITAHPISLCSAKHATHKTHGNRQRLIMTLSIFLFIPAGTKTNGPVAAAEAATARDVTRSAVITPYSAAYTVMSTENLKWMTSMTMYPGTIITVRHVSAATLTETTAK